MHRVRFHHSGGSVRFQLFRLVLLVSVLALAISTAGSAVIEWHKQRDHVMDSMLTMAQSTGIAISAALAFHDRSAATEALQVLSAQKNIMAAAVYTPEGDRLASFGDSARLPGDVRQLSEHLPSFSLLTLSTTLLQPVVLDGSTIGYLFIHASLMEYRQAYVLQAFFSSAASLLGLLLAIGLGSRFIDRIVNPVKQLADTAREVREKRNFMLRAAPPAPDEPRHEITELIESFNEMLSEIEQRNQELAAYQGNLENKVQERTTALFAANRELQLAKEVAEAATLAKSRFLAAAGHDLRQPIQAINLFKDALDGTTLSEEQRRISAYLALSAQNLSDILDSLLEVSRHDTGAITLKPERIDLNDLFRDIDQQFSTLALAKTLRFKLYFPPVGMTLFTDRKLLQSLLNNIISNAIKYSEQGGILIGVRRRGDQALFQVWDTGIGISPEQIGNIFDEYFQVSNPERDKAKGLGLGLAICKRLAKLLETEVVCRSRPGKGSVFEFSLPLQKDAGSN